MRNHTATTRARRPLRILTRPAVRLVLAPLLAALALALLAAPSYAAAPAVDWFVESIHGPTNFTAGGTGEYRLILTNRGAEESSGPITLVDRLPAGVETSATPEAPKATGWSCTTGAGQQSFTCTSSAAVPADGLAESIDVPVTIAPSVAEGTLVNEVTVTGGGAANVASSSEPATVSVQPASFGVHSLDAEVFGSDGAPLTQAGAHPYAATASFSFNTAVEQGEIVPPAQPKDIEVELPPGFIGDPQATPECVNIGDCPVDSQVGVAHLLLSSLTKEEIHHDPVFNMVPPAGVAAKFEFETTSPTITIEARVRSNGNYGITVYVEDASTVFPIFYSAVTFWGTPPEASHDAERRQSRAAAGGEASSAPLIPFLSNPVDCAGEALAPPTTTVKSDSWQDPSLYTEAVATDPPVTGCGALSFKPEIAFSPQTSQADVPSGYGFDLRVPQNQEAEGLATPELENTTVTLPAGVDVSPAAADGLETCSEKAIELHSLSPGTCPAPSKIGKVAIWTPLLSTQPRITGQPLSGQTLECSTGSWEGKPSSYGFSWLRDGTPIAGATGGEYVATAADEGQAIQCEVLASNASGSTAAVSTNEVLDPAPATRQPAIQALPRLQGSASVGQTDTCSAGSWSGNPSAYSYAWLSDGRAIAGAESASYTLTAEDQGESLQCEVSATNAGGSAVALSLATVVSPQPAALPPLLEAPLNGSVFVGEPECTSCTGAQTGEGKLLRLFIEAEGDGVIVKLPGSVSANPTTGQLTARFDENPPLPFEELQLAFKDGPRSPLVNPQTCGTYTTTSDLSPWSAPETADATPSASFLTSFESAGGACPGSLPFSPSLSAGMVSSASGGSSAFGLSFARPKPASEAEERSEQSFSGIQVKLPEGLLGMVSQVPFCGEPQANAGTCPAETQIGTATVGVGAGTLPYQIQGPVYLTTGYKGAPLGLSIVIPAKAGPFSLAGTTGQGTVVVRAAINLNSETTALTVTSDPFPQIVDGIRLQLHEVNVEVNRPGFLLNATNCTEQQVTATITGEHAREGEAHASASVSSPYAPSGCANMAFGPTLTATTQAKNSRKNGASLLVEVSQKAGEANIGKVDVQLPKRLAARDSTLEQACTEQQFASNPAACPAGSEVGIAKAVSPLLQAPLTGPAYLVSHASAAFPELVVILQADERGANFSVDLHAETEIKNGITYSRFESVPDAEISSFELDLPESPHSIFSASAQNLCTGTLKMPTTIEGQSGKVMKQTTKIAVTGCPKKASAKAKVKVLKKKVKNGKVLLTVKTTAKGTIKVAGKDIKTKTDQGLAAGRHKLKLTLTKVGRTAVKRHRKLSLHVSLVHSKQTLAKTTTSVKL